MEEGGREGGGRVGGRREEGGGRREGRGKKGRREYQISGQPVQLTVTHDIVIEQLVVISNPIPN